MYRHYLMRNAIARVLKENAIVPYEQLAIIDQHDELIPMVERFINVVSKRRLVFEALFRVIYPFKLRIKAAKEIIT